MLQPTFQSSALQQEFERNGFVKVPFLSSAEADDLYQNYLTLHDAHERIGIPFITTSHSNNHELITKADSYISKAFAAKMNALLLDYQLLFGNFLIKQSHLESVTAPHQDTTFVDECRYASISVWVSLVDTDKTNGCMRIIKGSHKYMPTLRPSHAYPWAYERVIPDLEKIMIDYPTLKGEAIIFHHGLIHASYANTIDTLRVAAVMAAYPKVADLLMLYEADNLLQQYKMTKEAYLNFVKGQPPAMGKWMQSIFYDYKQLSAREFQRLVKRNTFGTWRQWIGKNLTPLITNK